MSLTTLGNPTRRSVVEILEGFLKAQRVDIRSLIEVEDDLHLVTSDDDYTLVNAYIVYDPANPAEARDLRDVLWTTTVPDPSRTDMIVPDSMVGAIPRLTTVARSLVRRVVTISEFLDSFLRPDSVCDELTGATGRNADLLNPDDFVEQWAQVPDVGRTQAIAHLFNGWAKGNTPRLCIVLAPAGHGKSKITHILAQRLARHYQLADGTSRPPLPILISFGQYRRSTSFAGLILEALDRFGNNRLTIEAFQFLISLGRVLFILDGYDEMVEANPDTARDNITNFVQQAGPDSRILLTSRSTFYRTASDVVGQVGDPLLPESDVEVIDLLPFDRTQAREYLRKRLGDGPDRSRALDRAQAILANDTDLEILGSPIFLVEFANLVASEQFSISDIRKLGTLQFLVGRAFQRERERQKHDFTDRQQQTFLEAIAFDLLRSGGPGYSRDELEIFVAEAVEDEVARAEWETLASHHFLQDGAGRIALVTMRHQVWRDYFQGCALAGLLRERNPLAEEVITSRDLPEGVLRSAAGLLNEATRGWLMSKVPENGDKLVRNLVQMWLSRREPGATERTALPGEFRSVLAGRDLSGKAFTSVDFEGTDLSRANLAGCYLENCDLTAVRFEGTILDRTTLRGCAIAPGVAAATVASVTIDDEQLFGPQLRDRYAQKPAGGDDGSAGPDDFRVWVEQVLRDRLAKFVKSKLGENNVAIDDAISWTAFMGGTDPKWRDFVVRRLYRAMRTERLVYEGRLSSAGRPTVCLADEPEVQAEVVVFVRTGVRGPAIERVMARLLARTGL